MTPSSNVRSLNLFLLYLGFGFSSALIWTRLANLDGLGQWHADMISSTAPAPNQYRPLVPWLAEMLRGVLPGHKLVMAYTVQRGLVTAGTLYVFDRYLQTWFAPAAAAGGAFALAAVLPFTYLHVVQESDTINLLAFTLAFWAMARGQDFLLIPIVLIGTLNRETTLMLPAIYLLGRLGMKPFSEIARKTVLLSVCWCLVHGGLRVFYGYRSFYSDVIMWRHNVTSWRPSIEVFLLFGMIWVLAVVGAKAGPLLLRRSLLLLPFYLAAHYVMTVVYEVRLFLPWAPVVIPLAWFVLFRPTPTPSEPEAQSVELEPRLLEH